MNEEKITEVLEGLNVSEDKIVQIVDQLKGQLNVPVPNDEFEDSLERALIESEKDPFKRASLVAGKISREIGKSLDEQHTS